MIDAFVVVVLVVYLVLYAVWEYRKWRVAEDTYRKSQDFLEKTKKQDD